MKSEATPGREELAQQIQDHFDERSKIGFVPRFNLEGAELSIVANALRLAAASPDPDSMNERRIAEDTRLASNVREATIRICADIASACEDGADAADAIRALSTTTEPKQPGQEGVET